MRGCKETWGVRGVMGMGDMKKYEGLERHQGSDGYKGISAGWSEGVEGCEGNQRLRGHEGGRA